MTRSNPDPGETSLVRLIRFKEKERRRVGSAHRGADRTVISIAFDMLVGLRPGVPAAVPGFVMSQCTEGNWKSGLASHAWRGAPTERKGPDFGRAVRGAVVGSAVKAAQIPLGAQDFWRAREESVVRLALQGDTRVSDFRTVPPNPARVASSFVAGCLLSCERRPAQRASPREKGPTVQPNPTFRRPRVGVSVLRAAGEPPVPGTGLETSTASRPPYLRYAVAASFVFVAVSLYAFNEWCRSAEAAAGEQVIGWVTTGETALHWERAIAFFGLGTEHAMGLRITAGCSSALLIFPLLLLGAGFMLGGRSTVPRILAGTVVGAAVLVVTNQLRLCLIAWASQSWGLDGFGWSHTVFGSVLSLVGVGASVTALYLIAMQRREPRAPSGPRVLAEGGA